MFISNSLIFRYFGISREEHCSVLIDDALDEKVRGLTNGNPDLGQRVVQGLLRAEGYNDHRWRVAEFLIRINAAAIVMRWSQVMGRMTYQVPRPNAVCNIDGYHKKVQVGKDQENAQSERDSHSISLYGETGFDNV